MSALPQSRTGQTTPGPPALFRRYPALAGRIRWVPLGRFPTPLEPLQLPGVEGELWIKRDDLSGEPYGGNKVRKLEFLLAEARRKGATRLITAGAAGSHHALATTIYGRALGFQVTLVLFPQHLTPHVREVLLLDQAFGAELRWTSRMELVPAVVLAAQLAHRGEPTYVIPPGGSDAIGTLGYVSAALELAEQLEAGAAPLPQVVHVATGTMGTAAGLAIGFALAELPLEVRGYRITSRMVTNAWTLRRLVESTLRLLREAGLDPPSARQVLRRLELCHDELGPGYGYETPAGMNATERCAGAGLELDPTYTAKAAAGLLAAARSEPGRRHLFWHTLSASEPLEAIADLEPAELPEPFRRYLGGAEAS